MKRSERVGILSETILNALNEWQSNLYTAMPGIVIDIDASKCPVLKVQPAINRIYTNPRDGSKSWIKMPILLDVPLLMYGGGGITLTCPVAIGDECLVLFADRCIDAWYQNGCSISNGNINTQNQVEFRMHDLSDGFALVGLRSLPRKLSNYSTTSAQLRSDDGGVIIDMDPSTHAITVSASSVTITPDCTINGRSFMNHSHKNVQTGSGNTGGVV